MLAHLILQDLPRAKTFQGFAIFCIYFVILCGRWNYNKDVAAAQIINSSMDFEKNLLAGEYLRVTNNLHNIVFKNYLCFYIFLRNKINETTNK